VILRAMGAEDQSAVIALEGEIDLASVPDAEARIAAAERDDPAQLVIDLRRVTFMDSSGLRVLLAAHYRAEENGRGFALVRGSESVDRLVKVTGLAGRLRLLDQPPADSSGSASG
jgi:anti-sigma B factor antagonist